MINYADSNLLINKQPNELYSAKFKFHVRRNYNVRGSCFKRMWLYSKDDIVEYMQRPSVINYLPQLYLTYDLLPYSMKYYENNLNKEPYVSLRFLIHNK